MEEHLTGGERKKIMVLIISIWNFVIDQGCLQEEVGNFLNEATNRTGYFLSL